MAHPSSIEIATEILTQTAFAIILFANLSKLHQMTHLKEKKCFTVWQAVH